MRRLGQFAHVVSGFGVFNNVGVRVIYRSLVVLLVLYNVV